MSRLIVFEGPEGSGKSTQAQLVAEHLEGFGKPHILTKEPGDTEAGATIRQLLLGHNLPSLTNLLLFQADRAQHIAEVINPALREGKWVLCDRFDLSSYAYRLSEGLDKELIWRANAIGTSELADCQITYFLLDIDTDVAFGRLERKLDSIEGKGLGFHRRVRQQYLRLYEKLTALGTDIRLIDASQSKGAVEAAIRRQL